jgi:hypothetical protein
MIADVADRSIRAFRTDRFPEPFELRADERPK